MLIVPRLRISPRTSRPSFTVRDSKVPLSAQTALVPFVERNLFSFPTWFGSVSAPSESKSQSVSFSKSVASDVKSAVAMYVLTPL